MCIVTLCILIFFSAAVLETTRSLSLMKKMGFFSCFGFTYDIFYLITFSYIQQRVYIKSTKIESSYILHTYTHARCEMLERLFYYNSLVYLYFLNLNRFSCKLKFEMFFFVSSQLYFL